MTEILHPTYRYDNAASRYPFVDTATLLSADGFQLQPDLFVDAILHPVDIADALYLSSIAVTDAVATFTISGETIGPVCSGSLAFAAEDGTIVLTDTLGCPAGILLTTPDLLQQLRGLSLGSHTFPFAATAFVISVVQPCLRSGVSALADNAGELVRNDVWLVGENGVILSADNDGNIRVDIVGDPLWRRRLCNGTQTFQNRVFLKTINEIPPGQFGETFVTAGRRGSTLPALRIFPAGDEIIIGLARRSVT